MKEEGKKEEKREKRKEWKCEAGEYKRCRRK